MYDLTVIGDDLSSHVAAAYASHHGLSTLLIAEAGLGGLHLIKDYIFNVDPTPILGFGPDQSGTLLFEELGIELPPNRCVSLNPAFQIILPENRIDIFNNAEALSTELAREFPQMETDIHDFFSVAFDASDVFQKWMSEHSLLQPQTIGEYFSYLKIFPHIFRYKYGVAKYDRVLSQNAVFEKFWEALHAMIFFNNDDLFSFSSAYQYLAPLRGIASFQQGKQFLFNGLIGALEKNKGLYLSKHMVSSINPGKKNLEIDIQSPDGAMSKVSSRHLIISTKSDKLDILRGKNKYLNFSDRWRSADVLYYPFTIFLGVNPKGLSPLMAHHIAVVMDVSKDIYDDNLIILENTPSENEQTLVDSGSSLTATVFLPDDEKRWTRDALKKEANDILDRLDGFLPFLKENILLNPVDESIDISLSCRKVTTPKYKIGTAMFTSFSAKRNKTRFKNIYLTGTSLHSDSGYEAEILSGKNAAMQIIGKKD